MLSLNLESLSYVIYKRFNFIVDSYSLHKEFNYNLFRIKIRSEHAIEYLKSRVFFFK